MTCRYCGKEIAAQGQPCPMQTGQDTCKPALVTKNFRETVRFSDTPTKPVKEAELRG